METIAIIGAGFSGTMTAIQLIRQLPAGSAEIILINERENLNRGIAYNAYTDKHLLNVVTAKMGAFPDAPGDFLRWVMERDDFRNRDRALIAGSFLPRNLYGDYLCSLWEKALPEAEEKNIPVRIIDAFVVDLDVNSVRAELRLNTDEIVMADRCVIASGNFLPGNPKIADPAFYNCSRYFRNPWHQDAVRGVSGTLPVLIIGNGLTMVDTVLGLLEQGYKGEMISVSPNGFNMLPHRHNGLAYTKLQEELAEANTLHRLVQLVNRHIKAVREYGVSAEPVIDSLRPHTQQIWQSLSDAEKRLFMARLRHLWGVARHRIPLHTHDKIQQLRIDGKLHIHAGRIETITDTNDGVLVTFSDKKSHTQRSAIVDRVINCTGPETDLMKLENNFLKQCLLNGLVMQDSLKLGIRANTSTFQVLRANGQAHTRLFTLGSTLKGELWESTAVNELRGQAAQLASQLAGLLAAPSPEKKIDPKFT